jgi:hypothetical protein
MSRELKRFIVKILIAAAVLTAAGWAIFTKFVPGQYLPVLPWMLAFFTVVTILIHAWQLSLAKKDMGRFTRNSMIVSLLRLLLYSGFAIVFLISHSENIPAFIVSIVVVYMVFTFIEVADLARITRKGR